VQDFKAYDDFGEGKAVGIEPDGCEEDGRNNDPGSPGVAKVIVEAQNSEQDQKEGYLDAPVHVRARIQAVDLQPRRTLSLDISIPWCALTTIFTTCRWQSHSMLNFIPE
jgi:hypothetical protein